MSRPAPAAAAAISSVSSMVSRTLRLPTSPRPRPRSRSNAAVTAMDTARLRQAQKRERWHVKGPPRHKCKLMHETGTRGGPQVAIVGGFDVHRAQITFDYLDTDSGEVSAGQIRPATRPALRNWLERFAGRNDVAFAVEGCTGWRFVVEELVRAGGEPHLAEPADTATQRGRKKRAKTDRADARLLRELLTQRRLPESWAPPSHVLEVRTLGRLYVTLMDERRAWQQRIHAQLFHQGVPSVRALLTSDGRVALAKAELSPAGVQMLHTALAAVESLTLQILPLRAQLQTIGCNQPAVVALTQQYGIGLLSGTIIWAELGDCRRFSNSHQAVRF